MRTIGLIGGLSWESTAPYYRKINETIRERLGGLHSARIILYSFDFHEIEQLQVSDQWDRAGALMADAAHRLEQAGAHGLVLCSNTLHKVAAQIEASVNIPLLHIVEPTADAIRTAGLCTIGLLGTRFTMEEAFYRSRLKDRHGVTALVPDQADRQTVHRIIYDELCRGQIRDESRREYLAIIARLVDKGAQAIILGCTEIALLIEQDHVAVPLFDTAQLHAIDAADWALRT